MYKMFYFFLFSYAIYTCLSACFRAADRSNSSRANNGQDQLGVNFHRNNGNGENGNEDVSAEEASKRQDLVRGRLEFRKILASGRATEPIPEKSEKTPEINGEALEVLLEMGFGAEASKKALVEVGGSDAAAAMDWILDHPDIEEAPRKKNPPPSAAAASLSSTIPTGSEDDNNNSSKAKDNDAEDPTLSADNRFESGVRSILNSITFFNRVGSLTDTKHEECCSICLEPYVAGDIVARLKTNHNTTASGNPDETNEESNGCNHWFHEDCILEWLQNHDECPLCRKDMIHNDP